MKRWKTLESIAAEEYFQGITKPNQWVSTGKLDKLTAECKGDLQRNDKNHNNDSLLKCGVCQQQYDRPKLLHCLHSFCKSCVESLIKESDVQNLSYTIECPVCHTKSEIPKDGLDELPTNFLIASKLQTVVLQEDQTSEVDTHENEAETEKEKENENTTILCANCDEKSPATGKCEECAEVLCDGCSDAHRRVRVTRNHRITPLTLLTQTDVQNNKCSRNSCPKHSSEVLAYFCLTCDAVICRQCTESEHCQPDHSFKVT